MDIVALIQQKYTNPYNKPTDIIGLNKTGRSIANSLLTIINPKEVCFFDEQIKNDATFHYLDFPNMLAKTEIMIFATELSEKYYQYLDRLNPKVAIFIPKNLQNTITALRRAGFEQNLILL